MSTPKDIVLAEQNQALGLPVSKPAEHHGDNLVTAVCARWGTALICTLLALVASLSAVWFLVKPKYLVSSVIHIAPVTPPILQGDINVDISRNYNTYVATLRGILLGPDLILEALQEPAVQALPPLVDSGDAVEAVLDRLEVTRLPGTELLRIAMTGQKPATLAAVVNSIVSTFLRHEEDNRRSNDELVLSSLRQEQAALEAKLRALGESLRNLAQDAGIILADGAGVPADQSVAVFRQMLTAARTDKSVAQARLDALRKARESGDFGRVDFADFEAYTARDPQLLTLKEELRRLRTDAYMDEALGRGANHPEVRMRPKRIEGLETGIEERRQELRNEFLRDQERTLLSQIRAAEIQEEMVQNALAGLDSERLAAVRQHINAEDLRHERDQVETMLTQVKNKIYSVNVEQRRIPRVTRKSQASPPALPNIDERPKFAAVAFAASLLFGCGIAFLRHRLDTRLRTPDQVSAQIGVRVLGSVHQVQGANGTPLALDKSLQDPVRGISTALLATGTGQAEGHSRLITSPAPGSGKSSIAINLSRSVAVTGRRVLLIDGDNYRRGLTRKLELDDHAGLAEFLANEATEGDVLCPGSLPNLTLMPSGAIDESFGEHLTNRETQNRLKRLWSRFDEVIVDSPPILVGSHALVLATMVQEVVLVLRAGRTAREEAEVARERLTAVGARVVGAILNGVDPRRVRSGYGYGYGYDYTYGEAHQ